MVSVMVIGEGALSVSVMVIGEGAFSGISDGDSVEVF